MADGIDGVLDRLRDLREDGYRDDAQGHAEFRRRLRGEDSGPLELWTGEEKRAAEEAAYQRGREDAERDRR